MVTLYNYQKAWDVSRDVFGPECVMYAGSRSM